MSFLLSISQINGTLNDQNIVYLIFNSLKCFIKVIEMNDQKVIIEGEVKQRVSRKVELPHILKIAR